MAPTSEHSADEAGGEAIFTSDGLPSLSAPLPPLLPPIASRTGDGKNIDNDAFIEDESGVDPHMAFETFVTKSNDAGWSALCSSSAVVSSENSSFSGAMTMVDPRRRLFRLRAEIDQLEAILAEETASRVDGDSNNEVGGSREDLYSISLELKARLDAMGIDGDPASLASMFRGKQEDLSHAIARALEKYAKATSEEVFDSKKAGGEIGKIVYELYRSSNALLRGPSTTYSREASLEERLRRVEIAMGVSSRKGAEEEKSLLERLEEAELLAREVDTKEVEKIAAKAKVIR